MKGWQPIGTAPKTGQFVRLRGEWGCKRGKWGSDGGLFGWVESRGGLKGLIWPPPEEWAESAYKDPPLLVEAKAEIEAAPVPKRANVVDVEKWSCVYVIGCPEMTPVKIGYSFDPEMRMNQMQTGCPYTLRLYTALFGPEADAAITEREAHAELKRRGMHERGEWFNVPPMEAGRLVAEIAAAKGLFLSRPTDILRTMATLDYELWTSAVSNDNMRNRMTRLMRALAEAA